MKKWISATDRLKLWGLLSIAEQHRAALLNCQHAVEEIIGEPQDDCGHGSDFVWSDQGNADELLRKIGCEVKK